MLRLKKGKKNILAVSLFSLIFFIPVISLFWVDSTPSSTELRNSKYSILLEGNDVKLTTSASYDTQPLSSGILKVSGSILSLDGEVLKYKFKNNDIIYLWVIINSNVYQAFEMDSPTDRSTSFFEAFIDHENLGVDIREIKINNSQTGTIDVVIQFGPIGNGQLLKSETVINIHL